MLAFRAQLRAVGPIPWDPPPCRLDATDDMLRDRGQMAAALGYGWMLPPELAPNYPTFEYPEGRPDDAID